MVYFTIYPGELEIKDAKESNTSISYLDILLKKKSLWLSNYQGL